MNDTQQRILDAMTLLDTGDGATLAQVCAECSLFVSDVVAALTDLALAGRVRQIAPDAYTIHDVPYNANRQTLRAWQVYVKDSINALERFGRYLTLWQRTGHRERGSLQFYTEYRRLATVVGFEWATRAACDIDKLAVVVTGETFTSPVASVDQTIDAHLARLSEKRE